MIHIYTGDGKGKTTAGMGLCLRAAGAGKKVLINQFLKDGHSSERRILEEVPNIDLVPGPDHMKFTSAMTEEEKQALTATYRVFLKTVERHVQGFDVIFFDEILYAIGKKFVSEQQVLDLVLAFPEKEWILTGRYDGGALWDAADYISVIKKERHPFDRGVAARKGVEY